MHYIFYENLFLLHFYAENEKKSEAFSDLSCSYSESLKLMFKALILNIFTNRRDRLIEN